MAEPLVRARHLQDWLTLVSEEPEPYRGRFFAAIEGETRRTIDAAGRWDWLPAGLHVALADALCEAFGPARAHEYYRRTLPRSMRGAILGPLVRTGIQVVGLSPAAFLKWAAHGWKTSFRDCGTLHGVVLEPGHGKLIYDGLPKVCTASEPWIDSAQGTAYGVYDLVEVREGVVRMDKSQLAEGHFELELEWSDGKK
jgi:hypothetical protein